MIARVQPLPVAAERTVSSTERGSALDEIGALQRETLGERVTGELRALLVAGRLAPGEKLSLRRVAEALGVSMMPVREAVSRLAADRALEVLPGRAVRVPVLSLAQFRELTRLRLVVEGFAAEEASAQGDGRRCRADRGSMPPSARPRAPIRPTAPAPFRPIATCISRSTRRPGCQA